MSMCRLTACRHNACNLNISLMNMELTTFEGYITSSNITANIDYSFGEIVPQRSIVSSPREVNLKKASHHDTLMFTLFICRILTWGMIICSADGQSMDAHIFVVLRKCCGVKVKGLISTVIIFQILTKRPHYSIEVAQLLLKICHVIITTHISMFYT